MGLTDWIPVVSQVKSTFQLLTGDVKGAAETQNNFLHSCPGVANVTAFAHLAAGDTKGFRETTENSLRTFSGIADGIPGVGHVKGVFHGLAGDNAGAERAFIAANRSTCVMGAGAVGFMVAGPVGAVAGGIAAGGTNDVVHTAVTNKAQGWVKVADNAVKNPSAGSIFDAAFCPVADGMAGYAGGQFVKNAATSSQISANKAKLDNMSNQLTEMIGGDGGTGGGGSGAWQLGEAMKKLQTETTALERSIGVGEAALNPKTGHMEGGGAGSGTGLVYPNSNINQQDSLEVKLTKGYAEPVRSRSPVYAQPASWTRTTTKTTESTKTKTAPLLQKTFQKTETTPTDPLTKLLDSFEELLIYKDQVLKFQEVVFKKFGFRLKKELCKAALAFIISCYKPLKEMKKRGVSQVTIQTLIEDSVENEVEDEEEDEDKDIDGIVRCVQWNMCGFVAQTLPLSLTTAKKLLEELKSLDDDQFVPGSVEDSLQFLTLLLEKHPHILMLNELKVREDNSVKFRTSLLGYKIVFSSSDKSGRAAIRGTAILHRPTTFLMFNEGKDKRPILDVLGRPELEVVKANFTFQSKQRICKNGMTEVLKMHNLTFVGAYLLEGTPQNFVETVHVFNKLEDGLTVFAGDLNMEKKAFREKWLQHGFVDMLQTDWKTNKQSCKDRVTETEIDYVMVKIGNEPYVTVEEPIKFSGRSIHYPIYFEVHDSVAIEEPGKRFKKLVNQSICFM